MNAIVAAMGLLALTGCADLGNYYGGYRVSCSVSDPASVNAEVRTLARLTASQLGRPVNPVAEAAQTGFSITLAIPAPPSPSVVFSYDGRSPPEVYISVVKHGADEDEDVRRVRAAIEDALRKSQCAKWQYDVHHFSLAGG